MDTEVTEHPDPAGATTVRRRRRRRRRRSGGSHRVDRLVQAEQAVALTAAALAVFFQFVFLAHAGGLWREEVSVVNTAAAPTAGEFWRLSSFTFVPPLWLLALRAWSSVGGAATDMTIRVFGLLGGLALPAAVWFALRRLTRAAPLASMALLAVNPVVVRWDATVHAWGAGAALAILAMVLIREASVALTRRRIVFAALAATFAVQCGYQNVIIILSIAVAAAVVASARRRWAEALVPLGIAAVAMASLLPYAGLLRKIDEWRALAHAPLTLGDLGARAWDAGLASGSVAVTCAIGLVTMGFLAAVQWAFSPDAESANRSRRGVANYAAAAFVIAIAAVAVADLLVGLPAELWQAIGLMAFVAVCAEVAVASAVQARVARITLVVLAAVVIVTGAWPAWGALHERQTNMDVIGARLEAGADGSDLIVVNPWVLATSFARYYTGGTAVVTVPPIDDHRVPRFDLLKAAMVEADPLAAVLARVQDTLVAGRQVWIVGGLAVPEPGESVARLPPAPSPDSGWSAEPYEHAWSLELGAFLAAHSDVVEVSLPVSGGPVETVQLGLFKGWK